MYIQPIIIIIYISTDVDFSIVQMYNQPIIIIIYISIDVDFTWWYISIHIGFIGERIWAFVTYLNNIENIEYIYLNNTGQTNVIGQWDCLIEVTWMSEILLYWAKKGYIGQ